MYHTHSTKRVCETELGELNEKIIGLKILKVIYLQIHIYLFYLHV